MNNFNMNLTIRPTWDIVKEVHEKTLRVMEEQGASKEIRESTMMVATELIENSVKYGVSLPDGSNIGFNLEISGETILMSTKNGINEDIHAQMVLDHIDRINTSENPKELYTQRLMELLENPKPGVSQLGLYRIAYEGQFSLRYEYENQILTVKAEKRF